MSIIYLYIAAIILCVMGSAFFSASEMSLSSANRIRLEHSADEGSAPAKTALFILDHFDDALSAILVGNNLVNIAASSLGTIVVILTAGGRYTWVSTLVITLAVIIFGETIPKILSKKNATRYSLAFSRPVRFLMTILKPVTIPVVWAVGKITSPMKGDEEPDSEAAALELHSIIEMAENEDVLDEDASDLVSAAIDFQDISAAEVMTARVDILAVNADDDWEEILDVIEHSPYSRLPVYEDTIDNCIGVLPVNRVLKLLIDHDTVDIRTVLLEPCYVYRTIKLPEVLKVFRASRQHLAIVTDEYGGTLGVVSMEDVLEQLVGDIWDETDIVEADVTESAPGAYELDGDMPVSEFLDLMKWKESSFHFDSHTVGGWCIEKLGAFPEEGSTFTYDDIRVTVLDADERRVRRILVEKSPENVM